jgi:hypothetical protein
LVDELQNERQRTCVGHAVSCIWWHLKLNERLSPATTTNMHTGQQTPASQVLQSLLGKAQGSNDCHTAAAAAAKYWWDSQALG